MRISLGFNFLVQIWRGSECQELNLGPSTQGRQSLDIVILAMQLETLKKNAKKISGMTKLVIVSSNVDVTTKYCRKKDSQYCVTAPFFATIYHDNRNHLGCCNAFWIAGKVMLLVPYFRKIANISIVLPQSCPIESYRDSIVEKCFFKSKVLFL